MISPLQPNEYFIEELSIRSNPAYVREAPDRHAGRIDCSVEYGRGVNAPEHFMISLKVVVEPSTSSPALDPYHIILVIRGYFNFLPTSDLEPEEMERMATLNGLSILYGLGRGLVAQATGVGQHGKYLLPGINFVELLKKKNVEQPVTQQAVQQEA